MAMTGPPPQNKYKVNEQANHTFGPSGLADRRPGGHQLVVRPLQGHELVVRPLLDDEAPRHDGDDVRVLNGGQAMGDDDAGATLPGFVQRLLHRLPHGGRKK